MHWLGLVLTLLVPAAAVRVGFDADLDGELDVAAGPHHVKNDPGKAPPPGGEAPPPPKKEKPPKPEEKPEGPVETTSTTTLLTTSTTEPFGNPLKDIPAAEGKSAKEVLKGLPKDLRKAVKALKPSPDKGDCKKKSSLQQGKKSRKHINKKKGRGHHNGGSAEAGDDKFPKCTCPSYEDGNNTGEEADKYKERADDEACNMPKGMWYSERAASVFRYKYEVMAEVFGLKKGYRMLDWGSGCGTQLDIVAEKTGALAVGIDLVKKNADWALDRLGYLENFCQVDGSGGIPFAPESFEAVLSNAALYHVKGLDAQCEILTKQVPDVLVPGGCAWFGWLGSADARGDVINTTHMDECMADSDAVVGAALNEEELFGLAEYESDTSYSVILCKK